FAEHPTTAAPRRRLGRNFGMSLLTRRRRRAALAPGGRGRSLATRRRRRGIARRRRGSRRASGWLVRRRGLAGSDVQERVRPRRLHAQPARGFRFDLADRFLQSETLAGDLRFGERRVHVAQLADQRRARALVKQASSLAGILLEAGDGLADE